MRSNTASVTEEKRKEKRGVEGGPNEAGRCRRGECPWKTSAAVSADVGKGKDKPGSLSLALTLACPLGSFATPDLTYHLTMRCGSRADVAGHADYHPGSVAEAQG